VAVKLWLLAAALGACTGSSNSHKVDNPPPPSTSDAQRGSATVNKKPDAGSGAAFVRGASLTPAAQFVAWIEKQTLAGQPRLVRLPVVLAKGSVGFSLRGAKIGSAADAVTVYANDAALGVGLGDRARTQCKDKPTCAFLCEGYWRGKQNGDYTFDVNKAEPIEGAVVGHAEVEGESGN